MKYILAWIAGPYMVLLLACIVQTILPGIWASPYGKFMQKYRGWRIFQFMVNWSKYESNLTFSCFLNKFRPHTQEFWLLSKAKLTWDFRRQCVRVRHVCKNHWIQIDIDLYRLLILLKGHSAMTFVKTLCPGNVFIRGEYSSLEEYNLCWFLFADVNIQHSRQELMSDHALCLKCWVIGSKDHQNLQNIISLLNTCSVLSILKHERSCLTNKFYW